MGENYENSRHERLPWICPVDKKKSQKSERNSNCQDQLAQKAPRASYSAPSPITSAVDESLQDSVGDVSFQVSVITQESKASGPSKSAKSSTKAKTYRNTVAQKSPRNPRDSGFALSGNIGNDVPNYPLDPTQVALLSFPHVTRFGIHSNEYGNLTIDHIRNPGFFRRDSRAVICRDMKRKNELGLEQQAKVTKASSRTKKRAFEKPTMLLLRGIKFPIPNTEKIEELKRMRVLNERLARAELLRKNQLEDAAKGVDRMTSLTSEEVA